MIVRNLKKIKEQPASHEDKKSPGSFKKIIFDSNDLPQKTFPQMINWARIPSGKSFKLHHHEDMMEIFIVTKGTALMTVGNDKKLIKGGQAVLVPEKTNHKMENKGKIDTEYFVIGLSRGRRGKTIITE